ncbi:hypothetical protein [Azonexus sp. R2A61]|uniref:hypothetical protein n=1 Tax=Azonexus sp. R2A61 TaxID=2744443 RepID=UPI001F34B12D|nr:hypothetical protein [Azonexus sp. R2A61]
MIDLEALSTTELSKLISSAMAEYQRRISAPVTVSAAAPERTVVLAPAAADKAHVLSCLRLLKTGGVIRASDVREYRRVASQFPEWFKQSGYPNDVRGAVARRYIDFHP